MAEAMGFTFKLGEPAIVPKYFELDIYQWMPDAHLTVMRHPSLPGKWRSVWSSQTNFFLLGDTPYPEDHKEMETKDPVLVTTCDDAKCWHNGGTWLNAMFPVDGKLVGILHAEDHFKDCKDTGGCSYKSSAVSHSSDGGLTWTAPEQIVTQPGGRPAKPEWGGSGDNCAVKGHDGALYLFYTGNQDGCSVKLARSTDPMGRPGTWYKYYKGAFSEPGLGGRESLLEELQVWGGNPSVIWNAGLQLYIMTWHSWEGANLHISSSPDLMHWAPTVQLVADVGRKSWYPTILGCRGDEECGLLARLYYTDMDDNFGDRKWIARDIEFTPVGRKGQGRPKTVLLTEKEQHSGVLRAGQELQQNIPLRSPDGKVELLLQINGYLVLYNSAMVRQHGYNYNTTISAVEFPGTAAPPFVLAMQEDGNLVAYNHAGSPVFYTETYGAGGDCHLLVSSDNGGYFAVLDSAGKVLYAKPAPPPPKPSDPATKEGGGQEECPAVEGLSLHEGAQQQCPAAATS